METYTLEQIKQIISDSKLTVSEKDSISFSLNEGVYLVYPFGKYENKNGDLVKVSQKSKFRIQDFLCDFNKKIALKSTNVSVSIM
jgi:hypothetical protein